MIFLLIAEQFTEKDSFVHRLDPRVKLIAGIFFSIIVAISYKFTTCILSMILSIFMISFARLPLKAVLRRLLVINGLILLLWCILPFTVKGERLFGLGRLSISKEGIYYALLITMKSNSIILFLISTLSTMSIFTVGKALGALYVPEKVIQLLLFTYRYIHVIEMEYQRLINAIKIRGFRARNNIHTYRTYAYLIGMLLVKSYDRSKRVYSAMLLRGFKGKFYDLTEFSMKSSDIVTGVALFILITAIGLV